MQNKRYLFLLLFVGVILFAGFLLYKNQTKIVEAGAGQNVSGFAWSSNLGWISFNNTSGGGGNNYGVNIVDNGNTGLFSGYAWSSSAGWIDFNPPDLANCPDAPSPCQRATVDKITGQVSGWAKILTTNDWVRLRKTGANAFGVSISKATGTEGDFLGWAWGGETAGWMSFNCSQAETGSICPSANYKVITSFDMNIKPTVAVGAPPNPVSVNLCSNPAYNFSWVFSDLDVGDTQRQYELQVDREGTFASFVAGEVDITAITSAQSKEILMAKTPGLNQLGYNTPYYWRIKVWDNKDRPSSESAWSNVGNFTTPTHIYPTPYFDWSPKPIIKDQLIQFSSDASNCYSDLNVEGSCAGKTFVWTKPATAEFASSTTASTPNPVIKFNNSGSNQLVSLQITDNIGACSTSTGVRVTLPLPKWKEILPE
ncbi:MAG: hypothetical protein Q7R99_03020 [bacterium]|nr:hypothetical protein [bacterium]